MRIFEKDGKKIIELEKEDELFQLKNGFYLLIAGGLKKVKTRPISEGEVIKKLLSLPAEKRLKKEVEKIFSKEELEVLNHLVEKGDVLLFVEKKTGEPFYFVSKRLFGKYKGRETSSSPEEKLEKEGYIVVEDEETMKRIEEFVRKTGMKVRGTKHFDGKYYIVAEFLVEKYRKRIRRILEEHERSINEISEILRIEPEKVKAILVVMNEMGEVTEVKENVFSAV